MIRNVVFRIPLLRTFIPRGTRPLLPLTRLTATHDVRISLGGPQRARLFQSSAPRRLSPPPSPSDESHGTHLPPNASLSQKLKHLIKSYGWYALGVYIILSTLDFTVAFAAVNILGAEHVTHATNAVKEMVSGFFPAKPVEPGREEIETSMSKSGGSEGIWAMLVLAYTIHKTLFLPVRVGLTAAVTPRLVHWLRSKGWAGSAGTKRAAQEMREKIRNRRDSRD